MAATDISLDLDATYTLPEILKQKAPNGSYMPAIDVLSGRWPMLEEGQWVQANDDTSHEFIRTVNEPSGTLVRYNEGTDAEAVSTQTIREQIARMESVLKIDVRILEKSPDPVAYIRDQEAAFMRGMIKHWHKIIFSAVNVATHASQTFFGDMVADVKSINGLAKRYNTTTTAASAVDNVRVFSGGDDDATSASIWLIKHGPTGLQFLYPRTVSRTLNIRNMKEQLVLDSASKAYVAIWERFEWEFGLMVGDERNVQRLRGIDSTVADVWSGNASNVSENALIDMIERLPGGDPSGCVFYGGASIMAGMRKMLNSKTNVYFDEQTVWGRKMITFQGIPVVRCDALKSNEEMTSTSS
jgi:hypothetical protein